MKPRYECNECGFTEVEARERGCGEFEPRWQKVRFDDGTRRWTEQVRITACPMEIKSRFRRFLHDWFGILLP